MELIGTQTMNQIVKECPRGMSWSSMCYLSREPELECLWRLNLVQRWKGIIPLFVFTSSMCLEQAIIFCPVINLSIIVNATTLGLLESSIVVTDWDLAILCYYCVKMFARFMLDNRSLVEGKSVLDLGSGCGSLSIAAAIMGNTAEITANDIDPGKWHTRWTLFSTSRDCLPCHIQTAPQKWWYSPQL